MQLDFNDKTSQYVLKVPRGEGDPRAIMREHGLNFFEGSPYETAILSTPEPYAAVSFWDYAVPRARERLNTLHEMIELSWQQESQGHVKCPADEELSPFQIAGVEYALRRNNTLIGDQPGLGKTMQAICYANEIGAKRVLVLCPANIRLQWVKQIRRWSTMDWGYIIYPILKGSHGVNPHAQWTVTSYDLAGTPAIQEALARGLYDCLILDEGHYLKTVDARRTRAVFGRLDGKDEITPLFKRAGSILALTGTPLPNRPREAYTLSRGLCWDAIDFMSEDSFRDRFNPSIKGTTPDGRVFIDERVGRHGELQSRLRANFMVRRLKREVMPQLKVPLLDIVALEPTGPVKQALAAESLLDIDPENLEGADAKVLGQIAAVRRMMGIALAPQAADYVDMVLDGGEEKVLVFAWHIEVLNILQQRFTRYGVVRVDGSTSAPRKEKLKERFIEERSIRCFIGNMQSIGTGTDGVQAVCSHAVFAESDWVAGNNEQAVDRLDRMGQLGTVLADFLVAPGSISERVLAAALRKRQNTHKALDRRM